MFFNVLENCLIEVLSIKVIKNFGKLNLRVGKFACTTPVAKPLSLPPCLLASSKNNILIPKRLLQLNHAIEGKYVSELSVSLSQKKKLFVVDKK